MGYYASYVKEDGVKERVTFDDLRGTGPKQVMLRINVTVTRNGKLISDALTPEGNYYLEFKVWDFETDHPSLKNVYSGMGWVQEGTTPQPPSQETLLELEIFDKINTMKYLQGQDITISCEVDGDVELESGGVLFQYQLEGQDTYTDVKAEVTTSSTGKKRIWVRVKLP